MSHQACQNCGYYKGREVIKIKTKATPRQQKEEAKKQAKEEAKQAKKD